MSSDEATALSTHPAIPALKRAVDIALALALTVLTAPLLLMALVLVGLTSAGPLIYSQTRMGRGRRLFTIFKVRTMFHDCERHTGPKWSTDNDPRVTPVGRFLRKTHLDELPQLWNVLRGEMSLVGPRPERPEFVTQLERAVPRYSERLTVLPGVTGLAQVNLPPDTDHESVRRKLVYDLYYVDHVGLWFDARIMIGTALYLLGVSRVLTAKMLGLCPEPSSDREVRPRPLDVPQGREMVSKAVPVWRDL
jgi:lipopolysaccharide/colanic/teichoic acid biosynthesis glycosyltransferase